MKFFLIVCAGLLLVTSAFTQVESIRSQGYTLPQFSFDALVYASGDPKVNRLDVYIEVPYENLRFATAGTQFVAQYEATVDLIDESDVVVGEQSWTESVQAASFAETSSRSEYSLTQRQFKVRPGNYTVLVQVRDSETRKAVRQKRSITVRDFSAPLLNMSDIMLVNQLFEEGDRKTIVPNIGANVANLREGFYLFFEIYNRLGVDSFTVAYAIRNEKQKTLTSSTMVYLAPGERTQAFVRIPDPQLPTGNYLITVNITPVDVKHFPGLMATASHILTVRWRGVPPSVADLDIAIEQLRYIATDAEYDSLKGATTEEEKVRRFREFWQKRDPSPGTERNEAMDEYYARVAYANEHFASFLPGWKTDMGLVYIILGPPDDIDRHPFESDTRPYEVWYYNRFQRSFLFIDQSGLGDYRLSPLTPLSDVWQIYR